MKSAALSLSSRKYPYAVPAGVFVPDLLIAFTITPRERPCVTSKRAVTISNSPIDSRLNFGCTTLPYDIPLVTSCPSMFSW